MKNLTATCRKKEIISLTQYTKISRKWIKDLNVRPDTVKLLEENIEYSLTNCSKTFLDLSPIIMEIITKINKWTLLKLKSFCTTETVNKTKRQSTDWEKIFANDVTDKEFVSKIYKVHYVLQHQNKQLNQQMVRRPKSA